MGRCYWLAISTSTELPVPRSSIQVKYWSEMDVSGSYRTSLCKMKIKYLLSLSLFLLVEFCYFYYFIIVRDPENSIRSYNNLPMFSDELWPLNVDMQEVVWRFEQHVDIGFRPITTFVDFHREHTSQDCTLINKTPPLLVILVKSATRNSAHRTVIRETWGNRSRLDAFHTKLLFLLGKDPRRPNFDPVIRNESILFGDIIQGNFIDAYFNNTVKTLMGFNWFQKFCINATNILFVDDDYLIEIDSLYRLLRIQSLNKTQYYGYFYPHQPHRHKISQWYVSIETYPFRDYPTFINAGLCLMSSAAARDFYVAIQYTKFFKMDDVYIGIVAHKLGIKPTNINCLSKSSLGEHLFGYKAVRRKWNERQRDYNRGNATKSY